MRPGYRQQLVSPVRCGRHCAPPGNPDRLGGQRTDPVKLKPSLLDQGQCKIQSDHRTETGSIHHVQPGHGDLCMLLRGTRPPEQAQRRGCVVSDLHRMESVEARPRRAPLFHGNHVSKIISGVQCLGGSTDVAERRKGSGLLADQTRPYRAAADMAQPVPGKLQGPVRAAVVKFDHCCDLAG